MSEVGKALGWDDAIEKDSSDFILLEEGDYAFEVVAFERGRHNGSEKLPACNKAIVTIEIIAPEGVSRIIHNIFLHTKTEGLISAFFSSIGQKKKGEKMQMNWSSVIGTIGRCKVGIRTWIDKDGNERQTNEVKKFYPKEDDYVTPPATTFAAGKF